MIRLDDLTARRGWVFDEPIASGRADTLTDVRATIADAEARTAAGEWVVLVLAYEAAPAFDPAMRTASRPPSGTPFAWWQSFDRRRVTDSPDFGESRVASRRRRQNVVSYPDAVRRVREHIAAGDVYQVNVTDRFEGTVDGTAAAMYAGLVGVQTCEFAAYVEMDERVVVSASPELFFRWDGDTITCRPMKGTAPRQPRPDDDRVAATALRSSDKELAENVMIVDLLRNDLGRLATIGSVDVPRLFDLERYETVWQLTSTVQARVPATTTLTDVLGALFPCGSVTGAPKISAMSIIDELEADPRGVYCGAIGVLGPVGHDRRAVFSVPIRTAVVDARAGTYEYGAGAGITWSSDPDAEDEEVRSKARILLRSRRVLDLLETLRLDDDGVHHAALHLDRMAASATWFGFDFDRDGAVELLGRLTPGSRLDRVRLLSSPDGSLRLEQHPVAATPSDPVRLAVDDEVTRSDDPYCCHKTTFRRHYDDARGRHPDADDVVLVNEIGHAIETTIANLAFRLDGQWHCPPLSDGGLAGVGRQVAIADGVLTERSIAAVDLVTCDELAVVSALRGWRRAVLVSGG